jgi:hypothetical protein
VQCLPQLLPTLRFNVLLVLWSKFCI